MRRFKICSGTRWNNTTGETSKTKLTKNVHGRAVHGEDGDSKGIVLHGECRFKPESGSPRTDISHQAEMSCYHRKECR